MRIFLISGQEKLVSSMRDILKNRLESGTELLIFSTVHAMDKVGELLIPDLRIWDQRIENRSVFDWLKSVDQKDVPFVITSSSEAHALSAFKAGALGFWLQPLIPGDVESTLRRFEILHPHTH